MEQKIFRRQAFGYNKQEVLALIESLSRQAEEESSALQAQLEAAAAGNRTLHEDLDRARFEAATSLSEAAVQRASNDRLQAEIAALREQENRSKIDLNQKTYRLQQAEERVAALEGERAALDALRREAEAAKAEAEKELRRAGETASALIEQARSEASNIMAGDDIVERARARADAMLQEAAAESQRLKAATARACHDIHNIKLELRRVLDEIAQKLAQFDEIVAEMGGPALGTAPARPAEISAAAETAPPAVAQPSRAAPLPRREDAGPRGVIHGLLQNLDRWISQN